jgi:hypothetical protein
MKIKSTYPPALVHLPAGWYIVAGTILEVDGVPHTGGYVPVPPNTVLADIEFIRESPSPAQPADKLINTHQIESESRPGMSYTVQRFAVGGDLRKGWYWTCTCPGFKYRKTSKTCKHINEADSWYF